MKNVLLIALTAILAPAISSTAHAAPKDLKKVKDQISDFLFEQPGVIAVGITKCPNDQLQKAAGRTVIALAHVPEPGIAIYFSNADDMEVFSNKVLEDEIDLPQVNYCPMLEGSAPFAQ